MINYTGIEPRKSINVDTLPVGAYVGKVIGAEVETINAQGGSFDRLVLKVDVADGEYKDHFTQLFESQTGGMYPARYKGVIRYTIPQAGSQFEQGQKKALEHLAWCLQDSNPRYKWDGDETKLAGLAIGFSVRERDWIMDRDGQISTGTTTEIGRVESVADVKAGKVKPMRKRELRDAEKAKLAEWQAANPAPTDDGLTQVYDEKLPF